MNSTAPKLPPPEPEEQEQLAEGTLISHLLELRSRLLKSIGAVFAVFLGLRRSRAACSKSCPHRCAASCKAT